MRRQPLRTWVSTTMTGTSLGRDAVWYGSATVLERIASLLLIPLLAKSLPQDLYGVWSQMNVSVGLCAGILLVGLHTAAVRFLPGEPDTDHERRVIQGMLAVVMMNSILAILATVIFAAPLSRLVFGHESFAAYARLLGPLWAVEALFELVAAVLRAHRRIRRLSLYYLAKNMLRVGGLAVGLLVLHLDLGRALLIVVPLQLVIVAEIYVWRIGSRVGTRGSLLHSRWGEIIAFSLPLLPYGVLTWANNFIDRYFLLHFRDIATVGVYALAYSMAAIAGLFYSVPGFVLYPYMVERWTRGDREGAGQALAHATRYYVLALVPFLVILAMLTRPLTRLLATAEYVVGWPVALLLGIGVGLFGFYQLNLYATLLSGKTWINLGILFAGVFTNIACNFALTPSLGMLGAAIATVVSNGILAVTTMLIAARVFPRSMSWRMLGDSVAAGAVMAVFLWVARPVAGDNPWWLGAATTAALLVYLVTGAVGRRLSVRST